MNSQTEKKNQSRRPGSSVRNYEDKNSDLETLEKKSKISKLPKRTYSLEGKDNPFRRKSNSRQQSSTTSMIPRPERKKFSRKNTSPANSTKEFKSIQKKEKIKHPQSANNVENMRSARYIKTKESLSQTELKLNPLECKVQDDFTQLKQNILKIPEFWTDADQTVKNILKNAVNIVTKQYPTADVEAFEMEIQNILKTTEAIKQEILTKTEEIVTEANRIYEKGYEAEGPTDEELKLITEKMEELRNNVNEKNNAFCDLLKCGNELKQIGEMKNLLKVDEKLIKENIKNRKDQLTEGKMTEKRKTQRRIGKNRSKSRIQIDNENILSCGDILRQDAKAVIRLLNDSVSKSERHTNQEDKSCQTMSVWASEIIKREESLKVLNNQILQLHQLCKDHITKFKSFNFQIKLRGMCNKQQNMIPPKDVPLTRKNKLSFLNTKDYDNAFKQKDVDTLQKNRLISQQKKLLDVRDELIEMLKTRCDMEMEEL